jgi:hypothetical protein
MKNVDYIHVLNINFEESYIIILVIDFMNEQIKLIHLKSYNQLYSLMIILVIYY